MQRWTENVARELLATWRKSGLSLEQFSRQQGFESERLRRWKFKLEGPARARRQQTVALVPVEVKATPLREPLELLLRGNCVLRISRGFDEEALARVVAVLGSV